MRFKNLANHNITILPTSNFPYNIRTNSSTQHTGHGLSITNREDFVRSGLLGERGGGPRIADWAEGLEVDSEAAGCVQGLLYR
jgi:hypothetical protein